MRGLVQQINQTLEHSLTLKGLKWRIQAARSGVPFGEIVLRNTLRYRVEEVFLIQGGSGLLIQHLSRDHKDSGDADAVSAMLTAIRDFARDTFDQGDRSDARLETIDAGDHTLWLVHGPRAYLACAIRGAAPSSLRNHLNEVVERIHARHGSLLEDFGGDPAEAAALTPLLESCLQAETAEPGATRFPWPFALLAAAVVAVAGWWTYGQWQAHTLNTAQRAMQQAAIERLDSTPGIIVADWQIETDDRLGVVGLVDPLATDPAEVLQAAGLDEQQYRLTMHAFESQDAAIAVRRARQRLQPPDSIELRLDDDRQLSASGVATADWLHRARLLATTVPGVDTFDDSAVEDLDRFLLRQLQAALAPPTGVQLSVRNGQARAAGKAPLAWIERSATATGDIAGLQGLDTSALQAIESERLVQLKEMIDRVQITFVGGDELSALQRQRLDNLAALIGEAEGLGRQLRQPLQLQIVGRTDGTGTPEQNRLIAGQRAETTARLLLASGQPMPPLSLITRPAPTERIEPDALLRRVEFSLLFDAAQGTTP
jgi:OOP family OmpA-OmpF porin